MTILCNHCEHNSDLIYIAYYIYISSIYITHYVLEPVDCKVGLFATVWFWYFVFVLSFFSYGHVYLMFYVMAPG